MIIRLLESIGDNVIGYSVRTYDFLTFLFKCIGLMLLPVSYTKSSIDFLIKQIYLSSIKNIFSFVFFLHFFLGSIFIVLAISFAINFNLQDQIGDILVLFVINEFSPFFYYSFFYFYLYFSITGKNSKY